MPRLRALQYSAEYGTRNTQYVVLLRRQQRLQAAGIGTGVHYPIPIHRQPIIEEKGFGGGSFPVSEQAAKEVLSLPVHPSLTEADLDRIAEALEAAARG